MLPQSVLFFIFTILKVAWSVEPQVYENHEDLVQSNTRVVRQPLGRLNRAIYVPQEFKYQRAIQQDHRKNRYLQQQKMELQKKTTDEEANNRNEQAVDLVKQAENRKDYDLSALNALVGQPANAQLEGLQRLLQPSAPDLVLQPVKAHVPITEEVEDIPNPNTHPNVHTNLNLQNLQKELDQQSKAQFAKALADAKKQAAAHVEAQHKAIAKAQAEAEKKALEQIQRHNEKIKQPVAEALTAVRPVYHKSQIGASKPSIHYKNDRFRSSTIDPVIYYKSEALSTPLPVKAQFRGSKRLHNHKITLSTVDPVRFYKADGLPTQSPTWYPTEDNHDLVIKAPALKKISITRTHSVEHNSPTGEATYHHEKILPGVSPLKFDENDVSRLKREIGDDTAEALALRKRKRRPTQYHHHNHSPVYHPIKPVQYHQKPDFLQSAAKVVSGQKQHDAANSNVIIINNSNDHLNHLNSANVLRPSHNVYKKPKIVFNRAPRPNIKNLHKIQTKIQIALQKVNSRG